MKVANHVLFLFPIVNYVGRLIRLCFVMNAMRVLDWMEIKSNVSAVQISVWDAFNVKIWKLVQNAIRYITLSKTELHANATTHTTWIAQNASFAQFHWKDANFATMRTSVQHAKPNKTFSLKMINAFVNKAGLSKVIHVSLAQR